LVAGATQLGLATFFGPEASEGLEAIGVDSRFFGLLGISPYLGRSFDQADERSPALLSRDGETPLPIIIGYGVWVTRFGGDPEILAGIRTLGGRRVRVVGVLAAGVKFPNESNVWAPVSSERGRPPALVRLAAGATIEDLTVRFPQLAFMPLRESVRPGDSASVVLLFVAATLLVLVAWVQIAALVWSGTIARLGELGLSLALGATRMRLLRQFWMEAAAVTSVVLGLVWLATPPLTTLVVISCDECLPSGFSLVAPGASGSCLRGCAVYW
jgi:putative ABC transport system permease protein